MKRSRFGLIASIAVCIFAAPFAAEAQPPIRIGASLSQTGALAALGQNQLRGYPGAREFVESYRKEFPGADLSYQSAAGYGGCQILVEAIRRAGSLSSEKLRDAILKLDHNTVFGAFRVDRDGVQLAHKRLLFQWQDGKKVIVWPEELAANQPRFPTPPWSQRP